MLLRLPQDMLLHPASCSINVLAVLGNNRFTLVLSITTKICSFGVKLLLDNQYEMSCIPHHVSGMFDANVARLSWLLVEESLSLKVCQ
jgi:hypothetical protein